MKCLVIWRWLSLDSWTTAQFRLPDAHPSSRRQRFFLDLFLSRRSLGRVLSADVVDHYAF